MTQRAKGSFEVKLRPLEPYEKAPASTLGRMSIDKQFHGDLEAISRGEMLSAGSPAKGSAGYVAMERVVGILDGRRGGFVLQHSATMAHGAQEMNIRVVPDSGTDQLSGLAGAMIILITDGKHSYELEYTLPEG